MFDSTSHCRLRRFHSAAVAMKLPYSASATTVCS
jgi:hypothetical protein